MEDVKSTLRKLKPFIGKKADGLWVRYNTADRIEKQEWMQVINLLAEKYRVNAIEENVTLPPPIKEESRGEIPIGNIQYLDHPTHEFGLTLPELTRHIGIFGSTGTGKTTLAKNILRALLKKQIPFIVFDWEKNYRDLIKEHKEVKIFTIGTDISPFYFNYFKMPEGISYKEYVKNVIEIFNKAYVGGAGSDSVLLQVFDKAYCQNEIPTTEDAKKILDGEMRGKLRGREMLWKQSSLRMLQFLCYGGTGKVYNADNSFPMEKLYWKEGAVWGTILLVFLILAVTLDNFVRPFLIRKGADLPLILVFSGVIGGLIAFGIIGLFIGPVLLAVAYTLLKAWVSGNVPAETGAVGEDRDA